MRHMPICGLAKFVKKPSIAKPIPNLTAILEFKKLAILFLIE